MTKKKFSYNKALEEIEEILTSLESGEIPIDDLVEKVKRATDLINQCRAMLQSTEEDLEQSLGELDQD